MTSKALKIRPKVKRELERNLWKRSLEERIAVLEIFEDITTDRDQIDLLAALRHIKNGGEIR